MFDDLTIFLIYDLLFTFLKNWMQVIFEPLNNNKIKIKFSYFFPTKILKTITFIPGDKVKKLIPAR